MDSRTALIALNMVPGIGSVKLNRLIGAFGSPEDVFKACAEDLARVEGIGTEIIRHIINFPDIFNIDKELKECEEKSIKIITIYDDAYPVLLKKIFDPPPVLYTAGAFERWPDHSMNLGIVGTRMASDYGERALKKIIEEIRASKLRFNTVSGMARGIDVIAHMESLKCGIYTAAVLGFGLNKLYPFDKHYIAGHIIKNGCLVSEFPLNMLPLKQNFPRRNRVISGLSDAVLVVEAGERSGALITSDYALEQGRDVFAVPGSIFADKCMGTNWLIKQGAKPVTSFFDIAEEYELLGKPGHKQMELKLTLPDMNENERKIYDILTFEKKHIDNIAIESNIEVIKLGATLTIMEMKGAVKQLSGKNFIKAV